MTVKEFYAECGGGYEEMQAKFPSDGTILTFLKIYARDKNYATLCERLAANDAEGAFVAVHTLKGMVLNLNLNGLEEPVKAVTEALRAKDLNKAKALMPALEKAVERADAALKKLLG